jgi:hypothetical protein
MKLLNGLDVVPLEDALIQLKLTPAALEIPVPTYFVREREQASACPS